MRCFNFTIELTVCFIWGLILIFCCNGIIKIEGAGEQSSGRALKLKREEAAG
jgi:hypothetical protein